MNKSLFIAVILILGCKKDKDYPEVEVYGHAGATLNEGNWIYPPNSLEAIEYGTVLLNSDGAELDVQMTKDSILVLFHDDFLFPATTLNGCIAEYNWEELRGQKIYGTKYEIIRLSDALNFIGVHQKDVFLDFKPHNACSGEIRPIHTFNYALNQTVDNYFSFTSEYVLNSRNLTFLIELSNENICKSFETDDLNYGISAYQNGYVNELSLRWRNVSLDDSNLLHELGIPFTIFGATSQKELKEAALLNPKRIITDNIAYTKKITE